MRTKQLLSWAVPWHKVGWFSKAMTSQNFQKEATIHGIPISTLPRWDISSALFAGIQHFWNHSSPSHMGAQTLTLPKNVVYLTLTPLQQAGSSFSWNPTVPEVVGRGWLRSPLCNLLISDIPHNWFNKSCLLKWKPGRQKLFLLFRCLPENSAAKYFCAAPKASPETFHVSLYTSSSLSSSFYLHI